MSTWAYIYRILVYRVVMAQKKYLSRLLSFATRLSDRSTDKHPAAHSDAKPDARSGAADSCNIDVGSREEWTSTTANSSYWFQAFVAIAATLSLFVAGIAAGWNSPTIPHLLAPDSPIPLTSDSAAWLIQTPLVGELLFSLPAARLANRCGPKFTLLLSVVPFLAGVLCTAIASSAATLFVGRFLFGIGFGIVFTTLPLYLGEIASDQIRGAIVATQVVLYKGGILLTYSLAPYISIQRMAFVTALPAVVYLLIFVWMPESPYYLLQSGQPLAARRSLQRLRGRSANVQPELDEIERAVRLEAAVPGGERGVEGAVCGCGGGLRDTWRELLAADNRRSLVILLGIAAIIPLCGSEAILEYAQIIVQNMPAATEHFGLDAASMCIVLASVQLVAAIVGACSVDLVGRKPLLMGSSAVVGVCTAVIGAYFVQLRWWAEEAPAWMAIAALGALMVFVVAFNVGVDTVTYSLIGELFPGNLKSLLSAMYIMIVGVCSMVVGKMFQVISDYWGRDWPFLVFSTCSFGFVVFVVYVIPETRGRSLAEIVQEMNPKRYGLGGGGGAAVRRASGAGQKKEVCP